MTADQDVANAMAGNSGPGTPALPYMLVARLFDAHMFGLSTDYAYPEGPNVTAAKYDDITTLAKLLTRKQKLADGNDYDLWDCVFTCAKWVLSQNPHINDNEVNSVNYTKPAPKPTT